MRFEDQLAIKNNFIKGDGDIHLLEFGKVLCYTFLEDIIPFRGAYRLPGDDCP